VTGALLLVLVLAPAVAVLGCLLARQRAAAILNLAASFVVFAVAVPLTVLSGGGPYHYWADTIVLDRIGAWVVLCAAIVYLLASIYSIGYMQLLGEDERLPSYYALTAGFALTILISPLMNNAAIYWIAIELTTLVSTFLVAFEREPESIEAAWKYIVLVSTGLSLALLGTVLFYWNGSFTLGATYSMTWDALRHAALGMNSTLAALAFLLVLVGFGTKVGLAPVHSWLPDAHSESPAPISAMLSGALLNAAMLGIVRYLAIVDAVPHTHLPHIAFVVLGALSLLIAALFIVRQQNIKRLMAYSSVEHMGVIALGFGFGGPLGVAGALYHMLNHSLNKSLMFFGAGNMMRSYGSKEIGRIGGVWRQFPVQAALWLAGAVAITGAPPFALFLSELVVLRAGFQHGFAWAAYLTAALLIIIFIGFLNHFRLMYGERAGKATPSAPLRSPGRWCVVPMWLALVPLLVMGVWWPQPFWDFFTRTAQLLAGAGQ
jgi:hydrogenase-4 component F